MKIGIIGVGVVGSTLDYGFTRLGHDVVKHDIKLGTRIEDVLDTKLVFICVPTPMIEETGACDTSIVKQVVSKLNVLGYDGLVVIKSTVTPGTTDYCITSCPGLRIAFCPEFLREKATYSDFVDNHDVLVVGTCSSMDACTIFQAHDPLPKQFISVTPLEAEIVKYMSNAMNAMRIIFANQFFDLCQAMGADYKQVKKAVSFRSNVGGHYLDCNKNFRAFGGACLPKDLSALAALVHDYHLNIPMFQWLLDRNEDIMRQK